MRMQLSSVVSGDVSPAPPRPTATPAANVNVSMEAEADVSEGDVKLIQSTILIPGRGYPIPNGVLVTRDNKIEWVGSMLDVPSKYRKVPTSAHVHCLMPGLWDCHVHYMGVDVVSSIADGLTQYLPQSSAQVGAVTVDDLRATLMAGYTTVRELGGYANDLWPLVERDVLVGPNIYAAVAPLSMTGGHADDHNAPITTVMEAMNRGGAPSAVCDGVDECLRTVRRNIRRGARVIKVCSSGGVLSLNDQPEDQQFSDEELKAIVQEANRSRRAVAAHAIGKPGILAAMKAGVTSIEHGMYIDEEVADLMVKQGTIFVPTQHIVRTLKEHYLDTLPELSQRKVLRMYGLALKSYKLAIEKGVKIALGTDMISSNRSNRLSHGNNAHELQYAVDMGMTPLRAIECATANGPETLGAMAPLSGQLKVGYDADFIGVSKNPLDDISVLSDTSNITHVWKGGKNYKQPAQTARFENLHI